MLGHIRAMEVIVVADIPPVFVEYSDDELHKLVVINGVNQVILP